MNEIPAEMTALVADAVAKDDRAAFEHQPTPLLRVTAHARISELCLDLDLGVEARTHLRATQPLLTELRAWSSLARLRWAMVLANLQCGDIDEAEHWLEQATRGGDESAGVPLFDVAVRAEILLARGAVEAGLRSRRQVVDRLRHTDSTAPGMTTWAMEVQAVAVIAHAHHGRLDLVEDLAGDLPDLLSRVLDSKTVWFPICGALLLALAMVDIQRGAVEPGARLVALAERFRFVRGFQPTMSAERARQAAERADGPAYADAVSTYAGLGQDDLLAAAAKALRAHR